MIYIKSLQFSSLGLAGWGVWVMLFTPFRRILNADSQHTQAPELSFALMIMTMGLCAAYLTNTASQDLDRPVWGGFIATIGWLCVFAVFALPYIMGWDGAMGSPDGLSTGLYTYGYITLCTTYCTARYGRERCQMKGGCDGSDA